MITAAAPSLPALAHARMLTDGETRSGCCACLFNPLPPLACRRHSKRSVAALPAGTKALKGKLLAYLSGAGSRLYSLYARIVARP